MRAPVASVLFAVLSASAVAQSANDPLGVETNADANTLAAWERYYDTTVTECICVNGVSTFHQTTVRQYLAEGKALDRKVRLLQLFVPGPLAVRLASTCQ